MLVVVVRYFGGTKLGIGGLVQAYKAAADEALKQAVIIEVEITDTVEIEFEYDAQPEVMKLLKDFSLILIHQDYSTKVELKLSYRLRDEERLFEKLQLLTALKYPIKWKKKDQMDI